MTLDLLVHVLAVLRRSVADDRGDVPGWVMITVMTAAVAMLLWGLASETFADLFRNAFQAVGPSQ